MPTTIVGATGINKIQDGTVVDADIDTLAASKLTGALPALNGANLTSLTAANIAGALPAISGANLTNLPADSTKLPLTGGTLTTGNLILNSVRLDTQTANNSSTHLVQRMGSTAGSYGYIDFEVENPASTAATYPRFNMEIGNSKVLQLIRGGSVRVGAATNELGKSMLSTWQSNAEAGTSIGGTNLAMSMQHYGGANSVVQLGMGYIVNHPPAVIGYQVETNSNFTKGDIFFATRDNTADIAPTERLRIKVDGRGLSQFTAKAWVNFNGENTLAVRDSHNVSSVTDNGTGNYLVNFSNNLANVNYAVTTATQDRHTNHNSHTSIDSQAVGSFPITYFEGATPALTNCTRIMAIIFGD